jgi:hypothetical protein
VDYFTQVSWVFLGDETTNKVMGIQVTTDQAPISFLEQMAK